MAMTSLTLCAMRAAASLPSIVTVVRSDMGCLLSIVEDKWSDSESPQPKTARPVLPVTKRKFSDDLWRVLKQKDPQGHKGPADPEMAAASYFFSSCSRMAACAA